MQVHQKLHHQELKIKYNVHIYIYTVKQFSKFSYLSEDRKIFVDQLNLLLARNLLSWAITSML